MCLNFRDPKTKIFHDFLVFVSSPIHKNENSEITEIQQKPSTILKKENVTLKTIEMSFK